MIKNRNICFLNILFLFSLFAENCSNHTTYIRYNLIYMLFSFESNKMLLIFCHTWLLKNVFNATENIKTTKMLILLK